MRQLFFIHIIFLLFLTQLHAQTPLRKISLQLSWLHQFQFAGYYVAKEKGYFKEYGLDVQFKEMNNSVDLVQDVLTEKSTYAVGRSSIIIDKLNGEEIVALSAIFQHSPLILLTLQKKHIKNVEDLKNKRVMLTTNAKNTVAIHAMTASKGLSVNDITFQPHTYKLDDLLNDKTDAMGSYLSNEPYILNSKNIPYNILNPQDYGFDFYDGILFTSKKELMLNPIDVYNFHEAVLKGWAYAFDNIGETINIIYHKYNTQNKSLDALIYEAYTLKDLAEYDQGNLGKLSQSKIEEIGKIYSLLGFTKNETRFNLDNFIYDANLVIFTQKENDYIAHNEFTYYKQEFEPFYLGQHGIAADFWALIQNKTLLNTHSKTIRNNKNGRETIKKELNSVKLTLTQNDIHEKNVLFSEPIQSYKYAIATRNDEGFIFNTNILSGKSIVIRKNASINNLIKLQYPNINFIEVNSMKTGLQLVANGDAYGAIELLPVLIYHIKEEQFSNIKISGTTEFSQELRYMIHPNNQTLKTIIDKAIAKISKDEIKEIEEKYFQVRYETSTDYTMVYKIGLPLALFLCVVVFYNVRLRKEIQKRKIMEQKLYNAATIDKLTETFNRRKIDSKFKEKIELSSRYDRPFSIIFYDIDDFKKINDVHGHSLADTVLQDLSQLINTNIRSTDYLGRWGGEEFLILLPETNLEEAKTMANHLKKLTENHQFKIGQQVTCSFGVTNFKEGDTEESMLKRVDDLMYYVKRHGKNSVKAE